MTDEELVLHIIKQSARKEGFSTKVLPHAQKDRGSILAYRLVQKRKLVACRLTHKNVRYFTTREMADAFQRSNQILAPVMTKHGKNKTGWGADDPMVITKHTKYTVAPPPPERVFHTNTHTTY